MWVCFISLLKINFEGPSISGKPVYEWGWGWGGCGWDLCKQIMYSDLTNGRPSFTFWDDLGIIQLIYADLIFVDSHQFPLK